MQEPENPYLDLEGRRPLSTVLRSRRLSAALPRVVALLESYRREPRLHCEPALRHELDVLIASLKEETP